jgi:hypothetical protein
MNEHKKILYTLEREFGTDIDIMKLTDSGTYNPETGRTTADVYDKHSVKRALVFPYTMDVKFIYDLSYISANRNFVSGGLFERADATIVINRRTLKVKTLTHEDYIVASGNRYNVISCDVSPDGAWFSVKVRNVLDEQPRRIIEARVGDRLGLQEELEDEL